MLQKTIEVLKTVICTLSFHQQDITGIEGRENREFRYVDKCSCGKKVTKSDWTDDNRVLGHGVGL